MKRETGMVIIAAFALATLSYFFSSGVLLTAIFGCICYAIYRKTPAEDRTFVLSVLIAGFVIRALIAFVLHASSYLEGYFGFTSGDDRLYSLKGWVLVQRWAGREYGWESLIFSKGHGVNIYSYLLAFFYKICGFHPVSAKMINAIIGSLIGWLTYLIGKRLFNHESAKIAMLITMFYPSLIRWSAANLKDPFIICAFLACIYYVIVILQRKTTVAECIVLIALLGALYFFLNKYHFMLAGLCCAIALLFRFSDLFRKKWMRALIMTVAVAAALYGFCYIVYIKPEFFFRYMAVFEYAQRQISQSDYAGYYLYTTDIIDMINKARFSLLTFTSFAFRSVAYFMLTPFPWSMTSRGQLAAFPQMLLWYQLLLLSVFGFARLLS